MLNQETRRKIDSCRDILVGKLPDPKAQIEQITYALIYKFMGDMDKASVALGGRAGFFVNGYEQYAWDKLMATNLGGKQRLDLYSEAIAKLSLNPHLPQLFRDIFKDAFLPYRDPETLNMFLKEINWFTYSHSEDLGDAFEYLLSVMSSQGDAGQFRTPRHIIDFIVSVVDPKKDETILDPACGTAGFLISSYKHILQQNMENKPGDKLTPDEKTALMNNMAGYDISPDMVRLSLVNMYLHGFPEPHIYEYDTLTDEGRWEDSFDVIMANPPFMSPKGGIRPHKRFSIQANRSEVLFVDYIAEHLMPNGRAGVIVPEGIIFQSGNAYKALRKMLVDNYLFCVVSLPAGVFNPYSGVKTSILLMDKTLAKQTDKIMFVKIENDGFDLGAQRREIPGSDFPQALINIKTYIQSIRNDKKFETTATPNSLLVSKQQIGENSDCNLSMERYRAEVTSSVNWPMVELKAVLERNSETVLPLYIDGEINYIGLENISSDTGKLEGYIVSLAQDIKSTKIKFEPHNLLYGKLRPNLNKVWLSDRRGICSTDIFVLVARNKNVDIRFYNYVLRSAIFNRNVLNGLNGAQLPRVDWGYFSNIKIPLPPLPVQQEIVSEIEGYQKIIDGTRQVVENYKPQIKIDPRWPLVELGELLTLEYGKPLKEENRIKGAYPVFGSNGVVGWHNESLVKGPFIVVGRKGSAGAITYSEQDGFPIDTTFYVSIKDSKILNLKFLYFQLLDLNLDKVNVQSGVPGLNRNDAYLKQIALPTMDIQQKIVAQIEKEQQLIDANKELILIYEQKIKDKIAAVWET